MKTRKFQLRLGLATLVALASVALATGSAGAAGSSAEYAPVCSHALPAGLAGCSSIRLLNPAANWEGSHGQGSKPGKGPGGGKPKQEEPFPGYFPAELRSAYGLNEASAEGGAGQTVAIVDAYDDPNAESDLAVYRAKFGLGPCTTENGCFAKVDQTGHANYPSGSTSWSEEISLDLDMVSAICPNCNILLVEATSNSMANLATAAGYAAEHADVVSNSYGAGEFLSETTYDSYYDHPGTVVTVSSGDGGYGAEYPAASPDVVAVGGTTLKGSIASGWGETVWSGSGAGCSAVEPNPGWQPVTSQCSGRTVADVAAVANPNTGVAVYDSYGEPGWLVFGGTSVSSPIIASVYALAGNASTATAQSLYGSSALHRVSEGTDLNSHRCGTSYLCNAAYSLSSWTNALELNAGGWYNGPTGNGTPNGTGAF